MHLQHGCLAAGCYKCSVALGTGQSGCHEPLLAHLPTRCPPLYLVGLVPHKDVTLQGEAQLTPAGEAAVCRCMPAVCKAQHTVSHGASWCSTRFKWQ